ncbi:MAG: hypothetical protein U5O16_40220, partial [Rhodococcus sp. (in: high G+C Gram-positive bacteria)]|uniref:hypothetical protein n=1 Tax=Rhodococcus sp. TaxID=1831 RepID=UPI002ADC3086|nr:hypothetical protein [Rhodococcus sp. (in: high G+C Gram-positive bacteria)]
VHTADRQSSRRLAGHARLAPRRRYATSRRKQLHLETNRRLLRSPEGARSPGGLDFRFLDRQPRVGLTVQEIWQPEPVRPWKRVPAWRMRPATARGRAPALGLVFDYVLAMAVTSMSGR